MELLYVENALQKIAIYFWHVSIYEKGLEYISLTWYHFMYLTQHLSIDFFL